MTNTDSRAFLSYQLPPIIRPDPFSETFSRLSTVDPPSTNISHMTLDAFTIFMGGGSGAPTTSHTTYLLCVRAAHSSSVHELPAMVFPWFRNCPDTSRADGQIAGPTDQDEVH